MTDNRIASWRKIAESFEDGDSAQEALREACDLIQGLLSYVEHDVGCMNRHKEGGNCDCGLRKLTGEP